MKQPTTHSQIDELTTRYEDHKAYLEKAIIAKKEEIQQVIETYDDHLFLYRTLRKLSPLTPLITEELACLIRKTLYREIFIEVSSGKPIIQVANEKKINFDKTCRYYENAIKCILKKRSALYNFRKTISDAQFRIRELELINRNQKALITQLTVTIEANFKWGLNSEKSNPELTLEVINLLSSHCKSVFELNTRSYNALYSLGIITVEDLVRHLAKHGLNSFLSVTNFGISTLRMLQEEFKNKGIIDAAGRNVYEKYLLSI